MLSESDIEDIRLHYPKGPDHWPVKKLCEWLGCSRSCIRYNVMKLGLLNNKVEHLRAYSRNYYHEHKEEILAKPKDKRQRAKYHRIYYSLHPEYRERCKVYSNNYYYRKKQERLSQSE